MSTWRRSPAADQSGSREHPYYLGELPLAAVPQVDDVDERDGTR
jgi:hypothetical protein